MSKVTQKSFVRLLQAKIRPISNYHTFSGDIDFQELAASLQIMPFMAERNCVVVTDIYFDNMVKDRLDTLKELTSRAWDGTVLIISMPTYIPSKNKTSFTALIKRVEKIGSVCCFEKINSQIIEKYVAKWANENGKLISHLNASKIISNVGDDLNLLKNEVNKIAAYAKGEEITDRDIDLLSTVNLEARTYDMADDVINGRGDRAFRKLDTLFCQREEPINILYALSSAYVDAYRMRVADECSVSKETLAKDFATKPCVCVKQGENFSFKDFNRGASEKLDVLVETDEKLKSVSVNQRFLIEQLISRLLLIAKEGRI